MAKRKWTVNVRWYYNEISPASNDPLACTIVNSEQCDLFKKQEEYVINILKGKEKGNLLDLPVYSVELESWDDLLLAAPFMLSDIRIEPLHASEYWFVIPVLKSFYELYRDENGNIFYENGEPVPIVIGPDSKVFQKLLIG